MNQSNLMLVSGTLVDFGVTFAMPETGCLSLVNPFSPGFELLKLTFGSRPVH